MDDGYEEAQEVLRITLGLGEVGFRDDEAGRAIAEASPLAPADPW